jgi:ethanolamine utilization microcompartment shell protein EutL
VRSVVQALARHYTARMPWFLDVGGGEVVGLSIAFSPMDVVLAIDAAMRDGDDATVGVWTPERPV